MRFIFLPIIMFALSALFFLAPNNVYAVSSSSVAVNLAPANPAPGESTLITLSSYLSNLDSVLITWSINGKVMLSGVGKKSFSTNAPKSGETTQVMATVALPSGTLEIPVIIRPLVVTLLWQANDSYVPPFYKGKALPSPSSEVKVVAVPEVKNSSGGMVDPSNMVYAWKQDYDNAPAQSGYGKSYYIYTNDYLDNSNNLNVTASTTDQSYSSSESTDIRTYSPKILFYKKDPLLGTLWGESISDGHKIQGSEVIQASPYFISPNNISIPFLTWDWYINNNLVNTSTSFRNLLPLRSNAGASGGAKVRLEISNSQKIFESTDKEINVQF